MRRTIAAGDKVSRFQGLEDFGMRGLDAKGRIDIEIGGIPLQLFHEELEHRTTFVTFNGAVDDSVTELPAWIGWGVTRDLEANRILTSDPSLALSDDLRLAWYAGNHLQPHLQEELKLVLGALMGVRTPIFFGHSGGAFTAMLYGAMFPGSIVIAVNPQTTIAGYSARWVQHYKDRAWNGENWPEHVVDSVLEPWSKEVDSTLIYVQNTQDEFHVINHLVPFKNTVNAHNRVHYVETPLGEGHVGPSKDSYVELFKAVVANAQQPVDELFAAVDGVQLRAQ